VELKDKTHRFIGISIFAKSDFFAALGYKIHISRSIQLGSMGHIPTILKLI
jgi:hypothetical protein